MQHQFHEEEPDFQTQLGRGDTFTAKNYRPKVNRNYADYHQASYHYFLNRSFESYDQFPQNLPYRLIHTGPLSCYRSVATGVCSRFVFRGSDKNRMPNQPPNVITGLAWPPDGRRLNTIHSNGHICYWAIDTGPRFDFLVDTVQREMASSNPPLNPEASKYLTSIAWAPNFEVMSVTDRAWRIAFYQVSSMSFGYPHYIKPDDSGIGPPEHLCYSPNGHRIGLSSDSVIHVLDPRRIMIERQVAEHTHQVTSTAWHPSSSVIASSDVSGWVLLSDPRDSKLVATLASHHTKSCRMLKWNKNGNWLLSAGDDSKMKVVDKRMMYTIRSFHQKKLRPITAIDWNPMMEDLFVSGDDNGDIRWWSMTASEEIYSAPQSMADNSAAKRAVSFIEFHPLGHIFAASIHAVLTIWRKGESGFERVLRPDEVIPKPPTAPPTPDDCQIPGICLD